MAHRQQAERPEWLVWVVVGAIVAVATVLLAIVIPAVAGDDDGPEPEGLTAEQSYTRHCSTCHGINGQGAVGPRLGGGAVVQAYPDVDDQIAVITDGRGEMPPFGDSLTEDEIRAVADYTRTELSGEAPPSS